MAKATPSIWHWQEPAPSLGARCSWSQLPRSPAGAGSRLPSPTVTSAITGFRVLTAISIKRCRFAQIRWPKGKPDQAVYVCEHCLHEIDNHQKQWMLPRGGGAGRAWLGKAGWVPPLEPVQPCRLVQLGRCGRNVRGSGEESGTSSGINQYRSRRNVGPPGRRAGMATALRRYPNLVAGSGCRSIMGSHFSLFLPVAARELSPRTSDHEREHHTRGLPIVVRYCFPFPRPPPGAVATGIARATISTPSPARTATAMYCRPDLV